MQRPCGGREGQDQIWVLKDHSGCTMKDRWGGMGLVEMKERMTTIQVRNDACLYVSF